MHTDAIDLGYEVVFLTASERLMFVSSPNADWIREVEARYATKVYEAQNNILLSCMDQGRHFNYIAWLACYVEHLAERPFQSIPGSASRWLQSPNEPSEPLKHVIEETLSKFWSIASNDHLNQAFTVAKEEITLPEFLFIGTLLAVLHNCKDEVIADEILNLRQYLRRTFHEIRLNIRVIKGGRDFVAAAAEQHNAVYPRVLDHDQNRLKKEEGGGSLTGDEGYIAKLSAMIMNLGILPGTQGA